VPRKQDPIFDVMDFFEHQPLDVARAALALAKRTVGQRVAVEEPPAPTRKRKGRKTATPTGAAPEAPPPASERTPLEHLVPTPPPPGVKPVAPRKRKPALSTPAAAEESAAPVPLETAPAFPGLGPATVGD